MAVSEADDLHDTRGAVVMTGVRRTPSVTVMADATDATDAAVFVVETVAPAPARHDTSEAAADRKRRQSELGESPVDQTRLPRAPVRSSKPKKLSI